ncbi:MucB/RseB C-terminal domain-containing protein [Thalassotalea profundi]|uniref:Sigma-E factor regulatory protein RseB n=1 Tax=Thalassotalea profundi TaxID=2036687 RepID=A0ABQ3IJ57_9GAMM|nr:MucB/RseB C-terminal domain-containing protein [Thalassotalea profundi]GHE86178.1 sigma-E factor regulatory protein RseB [Thalassotalea profundi]
MKLIISFLVAVGISLPLWAEEQAQLSLNALSHSIKTLNFSTSFVVVKNNEAEPYHWFHGVNEEGEELEILSLLNGARRDILRKGNIVSYIEPELPPYSIFSNDIKGPIPSIFAQDFTLLESSYDFISVGRSRVLGRTAQLVRIVSKDAHRYGHWVWLDQETGLLLKLVIANRAGQLLEQVQFTHLDISDVPADSLVQLQDTELPKVLEVPDDYEQPTLSWQVKWLPQGFESISTNRHRITLTKQPVEFMMFSDGLVDISVYVSPSNVRQRAVEFLMDGATVALNQVNNGFEVSVVGKIPSQTAKAIADSVALMTNPPK